jgi:excisionase family DNA binding protein
MAPETLHAAFLTTKELAAALAVCEATVCRAAKKGLLPAVRIGRRWRFPKRLLEELPGTDPTSRKKLMRIL